MKEVFGVAVVQSVHKLKHEELYMIFIQIYESWFNNAHQIVVHVVENQVKGTLK